MQDTILMSLIDKFEHSSITELEYDDGSVRIVLRRGAEGSASARQISPATGGSGKAGGFTANRDASSAGDSSPPETNKAASGATGTITAPIVATFYAAPGPDSPPFVKKGDTVKKGQTLCILEAMKMMNNLVAEFDCTLIDIKVKTGDLVEFGQVLFEVAKASK